jgi:hypothetical protein
MQILRFHDLIAKIGIAKIRIPILVIHPNQDPEFSDPIFWLDEERGKKLL